MRSNVGASVISMHGSGRQRVVRSRRQPWTVNDVAARHRRLHYRQRSQSASTTGSGATGRGGATVAAWRRRLPASRSAGGERRNASAPGSAARAIRPRDGRAHRTFGALRARARDDRSRVEITTACIDLPPASRAPSRPQDRSEAPRLLANLKGPTRDSTAAVVVLLMLSAPSRDSSGSRRPLDKLAPSACSLDRQQPARAVGLSGRVFVFAEIESARLLGVTPDVRIQLAGSLLKLMPRRALEGRLRLIAGSPRSYGAAPRDY